MKGTVLLLLAAALVVASVGIFFRIASSQNAHPIDGVKLLQASQTYANDLRGRGLSVPATVSVQELMERGLLRESDVSAFKGVDILINLAADESRPRDILIAALLPDGQELVVLADGSVHERRR